MLPAERQTIQKLVVETKLRTVNWREVNTAIQASGPEVPMTAKFGKCFKRFADVFPADLHLGPPQTRVTDHAIELEAGLKPPSHRNSVIYESERDGRSQVQAVEISRFWTD